MTPWFVVGMLGLFGCDKVFGLESRAPIDATVTTVVSLDVPTAVLTGETVTVTATVTGVPDTSVTCTFSATRGSFADNDVLVQLDADGEAMPSAEYAAPSTVGQETVRIAEVGGSSTSAIVDVRAPIVVGNDSNLPGGAQVLQGPLLFGTRFVVGTAVSLRQVGMWAPSSVPVGTQARIGVYDADRNLVAATGAVTVAPGRNLYPLRSEQPLVAGSLWIIAVFDRQTFVFGKAMPAGDDYLASAPLAFTEPMPPSLPPGSDLGYGYSQFLVGID